MGRTVKLGRKMLVGPVAHHWAVKAGDTWYEVAGASKNDKGAKMRVNRCVYLTFAVHGTAKLPFPGCENVSGKFRQEQNFPNLGLAI